MNELDLIKNNGLVIKNKAELDDLIKSFKEDILLFTTNISMTYRLKNKTPLIDLMVGDELSFKINDNKYNDNEVSIIDKNNNLVGFIPEADSIIFYRLMDAGKKLKAIVKNKNTNSIIPLIEIDIFLVDY